MAERPDLTAAIAEAVGAVKTEVAGGTAGAAETAATKSPAAPGESQPSKVESEGTSSEGTKPTEEETPTEFWGTDLTGIPAEKRAEIIGRFEQEESTIRKLQARLAKEPEPLQYEEEDDLSDVTDEELLAAVGLDPADFNVQQFAPAVLPLLRNQLDLELRLEEQEQDNAVRTTETLWNSALDELEAQYGRLVFDAKATPAQNRLKVLQFALEEDITSPYEAYFRISAPIRHEVESAAQAARREAAKTVAGATIRPSTSDAGEPAVKKGMSLRQAVTAAAEAAEKETKLSWRDLFRKVPGEPGG